MKIKIYCFNKVNKEYKELLSYYFNKLKRHCFLEIIEIQEYENNDFKNNSIRNEQLLKLKLNNLKDYEIFLLEINGLLVSSENISSIIENNLNFLNKKLAFVIGPSNGFTNDFKKNYHKQISLGRITLPYNLTRIVLLEQIYRAFKIIKNQTYHK